MDETHFVVNTDDGATLEARGAAVMKYHDVVSGGEGMTLVVVLPGGSRAGLMAPTVIFQNDKRSHPIRGLADDVPGVAYRSGPKGWMHRQVFGSRLGR